MVRNTDVELAALHGKGRSDPRRPPQCPAKTRSVPWRERNGQKRDRRWPARAEFSHPKQTRSFLLLRLARACWAAAALPRQPQYHRAVMAGRKARAARHRQREKPFSLSAPHTDLQPLLSLFLLSLSSLQAGGARRARRRQARCRGRTWRRMGARRRARAAAATWPRSSTLRAASSATRRPTPTSTPAHPFPARSSSRSGALAMRRWEGEGRGERRAGRE